MEEKANVEKFDISVRVEKENGVDLRQYTGSAYMLTVVGDTGKSVKTDGHLNSSGDAVRIIAATVAAVGKLAQENGIDASKFIGMVSRGASLGIDNLLGLGHECTNCGKCGKPAKK